MLDEYNTQIARLWDTHRTNLAPHVKSIKNALIKYNKTKDPASQASISIMRNLTDERSMCVHPSLISQVDEKEMALIAFKDKLSNFKPKQSVLEVVINKSQDYARMNTFHDTMTVQRARAEDKKEREEAEKEARKVIAKLAVHDEKKIMEIEKIR